MKPEIRIKSDEILAKGWARLTRYVFDYRRRSGEWQTQTRDVYDRGHGAAIVPFDPETGKVLLVRQFRLPAKLVGVDEALIESCAGMLDADDPETCIRREAEEELGYRLRDVRRLYVAFTSPGGSTEQIWCFAAHYAQSDRISAGGGHPDEGEDIEVLEMPLDEALAAVTDGRIIDAKTIMLLQHLEIEQLRARVV